MLDYDIILLAKNKLPKETQNKIELRSKSLLEQITTLQFPLDWLKHDKYRDIAEKIVSDFSCDEEDTHYECVREFYTNNPYIAELLSLAEIRVCSIDNGYNGFLIACPSSEKNGLLFYLEAGILFADHKDLIEIAEDEVLTYLHNLEKSGEQND